MSHLHIHTLFRFGKTALSLAMVSLLVACGGGGDAGCSASLGLLVGASACAKNDAPVANAGVLQNVSAGALVRLDGSKSTDPNNDSLTYKWTLEVPAGSKAVLVADNVVNPQFTADVPGVYAGSLVVSDGKLSSAPVRVSVVVSNTNSAPVANAGVNQNVAVGSPVAMDGSASTDADKDTLIYKWALISKPAGSTAALTAANTPVPKFTADLVGTYVLGLVVNDGRVDSEASGVTVVATLANVAPVANAGANQNVVVDAAKDITLDGTASSDFNKDFLTYKWTLISKPDTSVAVLVSSTNAKPTFKADKVGSYVASLVVNDGKTDSVVSTTVVTASAVNSQPVAKVGANQTIKWSTTLPLVTLDGSSSTDADLDPLTYSWTLMSKPDTSTVVLATATASKASFTPDKAGVYVASLIVKDGKLFSEPVATTITVESNNNVPVANAGSAQTVTVGATATFSAAASTDADGDRLTYKWALSLAPTGSTATLTNATTVAPTLVPTVAGVYVLTLVVNDGRADSAIVTVALTAVESTVTGLTGLSGS